MSPLAFTALTPETVSYKEYQQLQAQCQQLVQQLEGEGSQWRTESEAGRQKDQQIKTLVQENNKLKQRLASSEAERQK